jgi:hypothetical protein
MIEISSAVCDPRTGTTGGEIMDKADFLKKIDHQLGQSERARGEAQEERYRLQDLRKQIVVQVLPILEGYRTDLEKRGIGVDLHARSDGLAFELRYADGGYYGFELGESGFSRKYTEDGNHHAGESCGPPLSSNFDLADFEEFVQKTIEDFLTNAARHGGFHRA